MDSVLIKYWLNVQGTKQRIYNFVKFHVDVTVIKNGHNLDEKFPSITLFFNNIQINKTVPLLSMTFMPMALLSPKLLECLYLLFLHLPIWWQNESGIEIKLDCDIIAGVDTGSNSRGMRPRKWQAATASCTRAGPFLRSPDSQPAEEPCSPLQQLALLRKENKN